MNIRPLLLICLIFATVTFATTTPETTVMDLSYNILLEISDSGEFFANGSDALIGYVDNDGRIYSNSIHIGTDKDGTLIDAGHNIVGYYLADAGEILNAEYYAIGYVREESLVNTQTENVAYLEGTADTKMIAIYTIFFTDIFK